MTYPKTIRVKEQEERLPYRLRETFLSTPELALLRVLQNMAGRHYLICPKVSLNGATSQIAMVGSSMISARPVATM